MANESKEALKLMQDNGCDVLDIKFIDLPGVWQHVSVPISEVNDGLFANGTGFDGSSIRGFQSIDESDMLLVPDKSTVKPPFTRPKIMPVTRSCASNAFSRRIQASSRRAFSRLSIAAPSRSSIRST